MGELIKTSFSTYIFVAIFVGFWIVLFTIGLIKKTKKIENNKIKMALRIVICSAITSLWAYFFVYVNAYPISLAYYEYKNNLAEEKIGVIDSIDQDVKDRIHINIDGTVYTMVYSSQKPYNNVTIDIVQGDTVWLLAGENSMYIFDISKVDDQ